MKTKTLVHFLALMLWLAAGTAMFAQTTAFTYHGRLNNNGAPVTGLYDLQFTIFDSSGGAGTIASPLPVNGLGVTNGLFNATLDFGAGVFTGPPRWLEISVSAAGAGNFQTLSPRQELTSSPYAIRAQTAGTAATATNVANGAVVKSLNGLRDNVMLAAGANVTLSPSGNTITIASTGGGGGETNSLWSRNGASAYYNAGNVGIGTSTPAEKLTIAGVSSYNNGLKLTGNTDNGTGLALENTAAGGHKYSFLSGGLNTGVGPGGFGIFDDTALDYRLTISPSGNVGIGTVVPQAKLDVVGTIRLAGTIVERVEIATQDALRIKGFQPFITMFDTSAPGLIFPARRYFQVTGEDLHVLYQLPCDGLPCPTGNSVAQMTFKANGNVGIGTTVPQAKLDVIGTTRTSVLTITGGADIAEPFKMSSGEIPKGSVVVIDEQNPGHLKLSATSYDTRVAGVVSGANGIKPGISLHQEGAIEGDENVALSGRVYVQADAMSGAIKPGDLLTTSDTPGHAMKVADHARSQGAILGKAMSGLKEGKGMVLVLVTLQ